MLTDRLFPTEADSAVNFPPLRPFQARVHEALREGFAQGHRCQMVAAPTGAGKAILGLNVGHRAILKGRKVIIVCDRTTLIRQMSAAADSVGLHHHGIIQAENPRRDASLPLQIASIQTLAVRGFWPKADVIIIDEAHTVHDAWVQHAKNTKAAVIGLSATPFTKGLGQVFSRLINSTTAHELTESGILVPLRVKSCVHPNMAGAALTKSGEWTDEAAALRGMEIVGDVVFEWQRHAADRKTIAFCSSILHCKKLCQQFLDSGIMAAVFTSETTAREREELLAEFRKPDSQLRILISVEALAKGFDVPDVSCVILCRPLRKSLSTVIQMVGRGLRSSPSTGKKDCLLLDHDGNMLRFAADYEEVYFNGIESLDTGQRLDESVREVPEDSEEPPGCPSCGYVPFRKRCMCCGFERQKPAIVENAPGYMLDVEVIRNRTGAILAEDKRSLWGQIATYARQHSKPGKQEGRAWHLFRDIAGTEPPRSWRVDSTPDVPIGDAVLRQIKARNIRYRMGRAA